MKICFLDNTKFEYSYLDKYSPKLRGAETILINLSENLNNFGHEVTVFNNCNEEITKKIYEWMRKGGFLEGDAGTGKSYAIEAFIKKMTEEAGEKPFREGHEYFKVAPTNSAANRISGKTFH